MEICRHSLRRHSLHRHAQLPKMEKELVVISAFQKALCMVFEQHAGLAHPRMPLSILDSILFVDGA